MAVLQLEDREIPLRGRRPLAQADVGLDVLLAEALRVLLLERRLELEPEGQRASPGINSGHGARGLAASQHPGEARLGVRPLL